MDTIVGDQLIGDINITLYNNPGQRVGRNLDGLYLNGSNQYGDLGRYGWEITLKGSCLNVSEVKY